MTIALHHARMEEWLAAYDGPLFDSCVTDLAAGIAAEHLVCADLLLQGFRAFLADQNCPYDVAVELGGRLIRVQVKATRAPRPTPGRANGRLAYQWFVRRAGKAGARTYTANDFDVLALVALDIKTVAYWPFSTVKSGTIHLRPPGDKTSHPNRRHDEVDGYPFTRLFGERK